MKKLLNRKEALGMIDAIFTSLHFNLISIKDLGIENSKERDYFLTEAWKIDQGRLKKDYEQTVNSLDAIGFKEYYKLIGKFATKYKIGCWKEYNEYEPILVEELNEELRKYDKTEDKLELINSFTVDELQSESFIFDSKVQVLYDILDDFNVGNNKEEGINTVLESFNISDKVSFIAKLQTDKNLINALIDKVNGNEKNQLLTYLYKFLSSADGFGAEEYKLPPKAGFDAKYKKGKVIISTYYYIDRKISRYKYRYIEKNRELNPFTNVTFCYGNDQNEITVPAIVLVKSRGDVVLYDDFYKSNIDWKSLTEEKKRELYTEFVLHYLPKELGDAAVGNPITFLIMIIVAYVISEAGAVAAVCISLIGAGFSSLNIIEGCKLITKVAEGYDSISDVNAAKVSAKDCARGIALLGVEIIPVLFGLIKRGFAKYNGKEIKVGENARAKPKNGKANPSSLNNLHEEFFSKDKMFTMYPFDAKKNLKPNIIYQTGEYPYIYETDDLGRIIKSYAEKVLISKRKQNASGSKKGTRLNHDQNSPGKIKGQDHSGHIFADMFGGSNLKDNLVSQVADVNTIRKNSNVEISYREIEIEWENAIKLYGDKGVTDVKIDILYSGNDMRPSGFSVKYKINGYQQNPVIIENK